MNEKENVVMFTIICTILRYCGGGAYLFLGNLNYMYMRMTTSLSPSSSHSDTASVLTGFIVKDENQ